MGNHYLVLTFTNETREFFPLSSHDTDVDTGIEAWVTQKLGARQRNRAVAATKLKVGIKSARIAHPTSCYADAIAEREARGIDHDAIRLAISQGRKRKVVYR